MSKLIFNEERLSDILNPLYLNQKNDINTIKNFEEKIESYLTNIKNNTIQSEDSLVANYLQDLFESLGFEAKVKRPQNNKNVQSAITKLK